MLYTLECWPTFSRKHFALSRLTDQSGESCCTQSSSPTQKRLPEHLPVRDEIVVNIREAHIVFTSKLLKNKSNKKVYLLQQCMFDYVVHKNLSNHNKRVFFSEQSKVINLIFASLGIRCSTSSSVSSRCLLKDLFSSSNLILMFCKIFCLAAITSLIRYSTHSLFLLSQARWKRQRRNFRFPVISL